MFRPFLELLAHAATKCSVGERTGLRSCRQMLRSPREDFGTALFVPAWDPGTRIRIPLRIRIAATSTRNPHVHECMVPVRHHALLLR